MEPLQEKAKLSDVCMICYTSGTTGVPKGAIISHGNMLAVTTAVVEYIDTMNGLSNEDIHISYLPMAHVFEHFVQSGITFYGARIGFYQAGGRCGTTCRATWGKSSPTSSRCAPRSSPPSRGYSPESSTRSRRRRGRAAP